MTDKTLTQNLTRTTPTDDPKLTALYLQTLAREVDQRMASHYFDLNRFRNPPLCVMTLNTPQVLDLSGGTAVVIFDTVEADSAGIADPAGVSISATETGMWLAGAHVQTTGLGSGTLAEMELLFHTPEGDVGDNRRDGSIELVSMSWHGTINSVANSDNFSVRVSYNGSPGSHGQITTVTYAEMYAVKLRDA